MNVVTSGSNANRADQYEDGDVDSMDLGSGSSVSAIRPDSRVHGASRRGMRLVLFQLCLTNRHPTFPALTLPNLDPNRSTPLLLPSKPQKPITRRQTLSINPLHKIDQRAIPLHLLLPTLPEVHRKFFSYLDKQLEKIEQFYEAREKEVRARTEALRIQLEELKDHRKVYYVCGPL